MNKTLRKAMLSTIAMLVVGVMSLTGVTYAWFSAAQQATVEEFNVTVETAEGALAISTDLSNWTSKVTKPTIGTYAPVSTTNALASGKFAFFSANLATDKSKINVQTAADADLAANSATQKGWTEITIYFQNQGGNSVTVDLMGTTITSANDAILATRIGMAKWGHVIDNGQVQDSSFSQTPSTGVIYEPYALYHTQNGANDSGKPVVPAEGITKATYYGLKGVTEDMTDAKAVSRKVAVEGISSEVTTVTNTADESMQITVPGGSIAKVTFYIWLEGQDCDCMNDVAGTSFTVNLKFTNIAATTDRPASDANQTRGS